ncbi:MAG: DNA methyltransferase [Weeksellaceae bacterium]
MKNYEKLQAVLREIFEIDKADLDFGIYRIMNQKRDDVNRFIEKQLPKDIKEILSQTQSKDSVQLQQDLDKLGSDLDNAGVVRESSPKYLELKKTIEASVDLTAMEQEIFSHLTNFFKRYYNEGDFISQRRYKKDVYAIPYEGEEVKLHWANADQYYIKTSEYLKDYSFVLPNGKKVTFQLKEASTEQNNNKTQGDGERRFAIYEENPLEVDGNNLAINFTYELHKKSVKQDALMKEAFETISSNIPVDFAEICASGSAPTEKNKSRTLLEKHLNDYISRNTFDYFIHKDLGGFLRRELDFYIKNEILYIDDINTENPAFFTAQLSKIKAFKTVADKIITFLAQIEDFQKKLWLKKKFVIRTDYCITLDKIPAKYYEEIFSNAEQMQEWKSLFSIECSLNNSQLKINDQTVVLSEIQDSPFTIHNYLVLDTKFFSEEFKDKLIAEFYNLDEETNGLLINSENFQALNLMQEKYCQEISYNYIDPPYNTDSAPILYKNDYKKSSWLSLLSDRMTIAKSMLSTTGVKTIAIDDTEVSNLSILCNGLYSDYRQSRITIIHNPKGSITKDFNRVHEYAIFLTPESESKIIERTLTENQTPRKMRRWGENSLRTERKLSFYPIIIEDGKIVDIGEVPNDNYHPKSKNILLENNRIAIFPIDQNGIERRWNFGLDSIKENLDRITVIEKEGEFDLFVTHEQNVPKTVWSGGDYDAGNHGNTLLINILGKKIFDFPKSINLVLNSLKIITKSNHNAVILDYFSGSGTTAHATIKLNRDDKGNRKYILVEMGEYFNTVTKPRVQKVIYSDNWKNGKPQDTKGISQLFKYQVLESYEDTLNNLILAQKDLGGLGFDEEAQEEYLLQYMLDVESRDHLFNVEIFKNPFDYKLKVTENNELIPTKVDLVETFNYLIGLYVEHIQRTKDIKFVEGTTREGVKTLVIWRNLETTTNKETEEVFRRLFESERTSEFHQIYINGDHNLTNFRTGEDQFKVKMIEETFFNKMFNVTEL